MSLELLHGSPDSPLKLWKRDYWTYASRKYVTYSEGNKKPDGVAIFGFHTEIAGEKRLLVTREFRKPLNTYIWALPAGLIDAGESVYDAATRELKEETNYDIGCFLESPCNTGFPSPGLTDESVATVWCTIHGLPSRENLEGHEDIDSYLFTMDELKRLEFSEYPMDSRLAMFISFLNLKDFL